MTKFLGGPANGRTLMLKRQPLYLRVTCVQSESFDPISWDALDQIDDEPSEHETIYAYRLTKQEGRAFVDGRNPKTGKRWGGNYAIGAYTFIDEQPPDEAMRTRERWEEWVQADHARTTKGPAS